MAYVSLAIENMPEECTLSIKQAAERFNKLRQVRMHWPEK